MSVPIVQGWIDNHRYIHICIRGKHLFPGNVSVVQPAHCWATTVHMVWCPVCASVLSKPGGQVRSHSYASAAPMEEIGD